MNLKSIAALAAALVTSSAMAAGAPADKKCGAGSCSKKTASAKAPASAGSDAACSKKEASCAKKDDAKVADKEASCAKKEAACSKK